LADLCAAVLHKGLSKNNSAQMSIAWEDNQLTNEIIHYAALDAYTSLCIYQQLLQ
jgi:ribonuclease D